MQKTVSLVAVLAACAAASGCQQFSQAIGAEKVAPDEFVVVTRVPLSVPPDFGLRPPRPGEARPAALRPDQMNASVFGQNTGQEASAAEKALVAKAGAEAVDPNIRSTVDFEAANIVRKPEAFANRVLGEAAPTEQQRLAEQESLRQVTGGAEVTIKRGESRLRLPGL
jgi:hypothetical protein